jgi:hypothetical protein
MILKVQLATEIGGEWAAEEFWPEPLPTNFSLPVLVDCLS